MQTILFTIPHVIPGPPISDDSDGENKPLPYADSDTDLNRCKKRKKRFEVEKKEWLSEKNN